MTQAQLFKYLKELREFSAHLVAVRAVRDRHKKGNDQAKMSDTEIRLSLIEELAVFARAGNKSAEARAIVHLLDNESGMERHMIFDSVLNAFSKTAA